jgi:DNA-binding MarR family transcriptional regulator
MTPRPARPAAPEPDDSPRLGQVLEFMRVLWALDHGLQSASKRMEATAGVTGPQRLVVRIVGRFPGISPGEVSDILHLHPSTLTGILKRLEDRTLVLREPDPADGRRARLKLSARGKQVDDVKAGTIESAVRRALGKIGDRDLGVTRDVLERLTAELES